MEYLRYINIALIVGAVLHEADSQHFSTCPADATSCCECVIKPGCIWSMALNSSQPRCVRDQEFSSVVNELVVPGDANRPFNPRRFRFIRPQGARLKMSIGLRKEVPVRILAQTRRMRLVVVGPNDFPDFTIERGDDMSCNHRFRVRQRINRRKNQKKLNLDCNVSAVGGIQKLHIIVDMTRCYQSVKEIKFNLRARESRRFKLTVTSSCQCPCQFAETAAARIIDNGLEICEEGEAMTQCVPQASSEANQCSGVNDYCRRNRNEPVCSGHGTCICGICSCDFVSPHNPEQAVLSDPVAETGRQRYLGTHCQCDNVSCPPFDGRVCGGPERGRCICGHCLCNIGYSGRSCEVTSHIDSCVGPDGLVCGGQGDCVGGRCECRGTTSGPYCQPCTNCPNNMCDILTACVQCFAFAEIETNQARNCTAMCNSIEDPPIRFVLHDGTWPEAANLCVMQRNECHYEFAYTRHSNGEVVVNYQTELHCYQDPAQ